MTRFRQGYSVASEGRGNSIADCSAKRVAILLQFTTEITEHTQSNDICFPTFVTSVCLVVKSCDLRGQFRSPPLRIEPCPIIS